MTSNAGKAREASQLLGVPIDIHPLDLTEIQSLSFEDVVRAKALQAATTLGRAVLVEDSGLQIATWKGFPGPLTKWVTESIGEGGLARMLDAFPDRSATAVSALAVARPGQSASDFVVVLGRVEGTIAEGPRGDQGFGWDVLFLPLGETRTFAEMSPQEKNALSHRARAFDLLTAALAGAENPS